ncbi:LA_2272 family surface repeat-containing protein [Wenyingzhuangia sp. IMCC45574]
MKKIITSFLLCCSLSMIGQDTTPKKTRGPIWFTHSENTNIVGMSLGFYPTSSFMLSKKNSTNTYGLRIEATPLSVLYLLFSNNSISRNNTSHQQKLTNGDVTQKVYGINISTGTPEEIDSHGISITGLMHQSRKNNGISIAGITNSIERANGIVAAFGGNGIYEGNGIMISGPWGNHTKIFNGIQIGFDNHILQKGNGIQIGIYNEAKNFKGIQLGLWNKNQKRSLPIINWNF